MKKLLSVALAGAMVLGMGVTAFASPGGNTGSKSDPDVTMPSGDLSLYRVSSSVFIPQSNNARVNYGTTLGIMLTGAESNTKSIVSKYKTFADWKVGSSLVEKTGVEYKKYQTKSKDQNWVPTSGTSGNSDLVFDYTVKENLATKYSKGERIKITVPGSALDTVGANGPLAKAAAETFMNTNVTYAYVNTTAPTITGTHSDMHANDAAAVRKILAEKLYKPTQVTAYAWFSTITLKPNTSTSTVDLAGDVRVARTASNKDLDYYALDLQVGYVKQEDAEGTVTQDESKRVIDFADDAGVVDIEFDVDNVYAMFSVDVTGQKAINGVSNTDYNEDFGDAHPYAELAFVNFPAKPTFNRTGDMYIFPDALVAVPGEDLFVYEVLSDGTFKEINFTYDEDYEALKFRTRKLTNYVVSDVELVSEVEEPAPVEPAPEPAPAPVEPTPEVPTIKPNPPMGR